MVTFNVDGNSIWSATGTALTVNPTTTFNGAVNILGGQNLTVGTVGGAIMQVDGAGLLFGGATSDVNTTTLTVTDPTAVRTITLPDASGTVALLSDISGGGSNAITQGDSAVTVTDTGSDGNIEFKTENTAGWDITSAGHLIPETNDTYDIGSAEFKVRDFYYRLQFNGNSIKNTSAVDAVNAGAIDVTITNHFITNGETYTLADGTYIG